jgi:rubrerythrin
MIEAFMFRFEKTIEKETNMTKTVKNLEEAFAGESQANRKYLAFAKRAADEYKEGIYKLFMAVAEAETIHAHRHLAQLKGIRGTKENLEEALSGEMHEFKEMYPRMVAAAIEEEDKGAEITLTHAMEVEKVHHKLFQEALDNLDDFPVRDYYVCNACGYTVADDPPDKCPVCGAVKKAFYQVLSKNK